jgi:hypothetical protein
MVPSKNHETVVRTGPGMIVAWATDRPRFMRQMTVGSSYPCISPIYNGGVDTKQLTCGCQVQTSRDFLGRVVGTILEKGAACGNADHEPSRVVVMPGRENARSDT